MDPLIDQPEISRFVREHDDPGIEIRVNFGVFAGRHATPAEIDELALALREASDDFDFVTARSPQLYAALNEVGAALSTTPSDAQRALHGCLPGGNGYLRARIRGALSFGRGAAFSPIPARDFAQTCVVLSTDGQGDAALGQGHVPLQRCQSGGDIGGAYVPEHEAQAALEV